MSHPFELEVAEDVADVVEEVDNFLAACPDGTIAGVIADFLKGNVSTITKMVLDEIGPAESYIPEWKHP